MYIFRASKFWMYIFGCIFLWACIQFGIYVLSLCFGGIFSILYVFYNLTKSTLDVISDTVFITCARSNPKIFACGAGKLSLLDNHDDNSLHVQKTSCGALNSPRQNRMEMLWNVKLYDERRKLELGRPSTLGCETTD